MKSFRNQTNDASILVRTNVILLFLLLVIVQVFSVLQGRAQEYTRGIGIYPGENKDNFSPMLQVDNVTRNLALLRPAYHSSSYDYNLTAQLITDGIKDTTLPSWVSVISSGKEAIVKNYRDFIFDRNKVTSVSIDGPESWIRFEVEGGKHLDSSDSMDIIGEVKLNDKPVQPWNLEVLGSNGGDVWEKITTASGAGVPGDKLAQNWSPNAQRWIHVSLPFPKMVDYKAYKVNFTSPNVSVWRVGDIALFQNHRRIDIGGPYNFTSAWKSLGNKEEWVYVDLGTTCTFSQVNLYWVRRAIAGSIQVSDDAATWKDVKGLEPNVDKYTLSQPAKGRYVRILMKQPSSPDGYILSELEVLGQGGFKVVPHPASGLTTDGQLRLAGGNWKVQRESLTTGSGESMSLPGYQDNQWIVATVPGTVLVSYWNAGALPDPNFGDNQTQISDSYFYSDFWYRTEFTVPEAYKGKHVFLNFDGINWKANIYVNGSKIGRIEGAFMRGKFDVTKYLKPGLINALAVKIEKNETPGYPTEQSKMTADANGGQLGADNPTFHASVGWDWIPTIRGRNTGIWNDVYLTSTGNVTIEDPLVYSTLSLPDTTSAKLNFEITLRNHDASDVNGVLQGKFGDISFEQKVTLKAGETKTIKLSPATHAALLLKNPKLWWPNGYGPQNLYQVELKFVANNQVSDTKSFKTGVRQMTYSEDGGALKIWVNGKRFVGKGGNWGFPESMLLYREREYNTAVRYHKDMNFTMIRNWVGQTGDEEFYEACDKYGIMVWQDFWLANPWDGPEPNDNAMFLRNFEDFVKVIRNHPSIGLYCGRNEGNPMPVLDTTIRKELPVLAPGVHYISHSADKVVSGGGPYWALPLKFYFEKRATPKFHSELGMPNVVTYESLRLMMPNDSTIWPQGRMWGLHDFCQGSAMQGATFNQLLEESFGKIDDLKQWLTLAQWINYEGYRAMFEAQSKNRMGVLLWMSHSAWPSMVWQTYDYYFEPTAAYFGCKKACEPLHIQWNAFTDSIEVVNYSSVAGAGLTASISIVNTDGTVKFEKQMPVNCPIDQRLACLKMPSPEGLSSAYLVRLKLMKGNTVISENSYWRGLENNNRKVLLDLIKIKSLVQTQVVKKDNRWFLTSTLTNQSKSSIPMIRLKVVRETTKDRILPVIYSDNYVSLLPGEKKVIEIELEDADTRGEKPIVEID